MFAKRSLHFLYFQERANIRGKLASTGRDVIELSFAEMASLAGNCFELTDGTKKFLAISKRAQVRSGDVGRIQNSHYNIPLPNPIQNLLWCHNQDKNKSKGLTLIVLISCCTLQEGLREDTRVAVAASFDELLVPDVGTIEHVGGGGIRCMVAGVHLRHK